MSGYVYMSASTVEYDEHEAALEIDALISHLAQLRSDGATHVVGLSGNYRGAKYVALDLPDWEEE